jgi:drug/metabolite transporter (DMT)-like permease
MELGVIAGLGSALAFGTGDFTGGTAARRVPALVAAAGAQAAGLLALLCFMLAVGAGDPQPAAIGVGALAGLFGGAGLAALYRGLSMGAMGLVAALSGAVLIPLAASALLYHSTIGPLQWLGVACALAAAAAASGATLRGVSPATLGLAGVAAVGFGLWFVLLDLGARSDELWTLVGSRASASAAMGVLVAARGGTRALTRVAPLVILAGVLDVTGNAAFVAARGHVPVGIAAALSGLYPLVTMTLARLVHRETLPPLGIGAIGLAVGGIVLISAGG